MGINSIKNNNKIMANLKELKEKVKPFKNTFVIMYPYDLVLLLDVIDGGDDYYWVYADKKGIHQGSCCCGWTPLKGVINEDVYNRMVNIWNHNYTKIAI